MAEFRREKITFYGNVHFGFFREPLEGLGATHTVHLGLIGKPILDFLLVIVELFC